MQQCLSEPRGSVAVCRNGKNKEGLPALVGVSHVGFLMEVSVHLLMATSSLPQYGGKSKKTKFTYLGNVL